MPSKRKKKYHTISSEAAEKIIDMWREGKTATEISKITNVAVPTIYQAMRRLRMKLDDIAKREPGRPPIWPVDKNN